MQDKGRSIGNKVLDEGVFGPVTSRGLNKIRSHSLAARDESALSVFKSNVAAFDENVGVETRFASRDQLIDRLFCKGITPHEFGHNSDPGSMEDLIAFIDSEKAVLSLVKDVKGNKEVRELCVVDRMFGVHPFPKEDHVSVLKHVPKARFLPRPVLDVSELCLGGRVDKVTAILKEELKARTNTDADVCTVDLLLDNKRPSLSQKVLDLRVVKHEVIASR